MSLALCSQRFCWMPSSRHSTVPSNLQDPYVYWLLKSHFLLPFPNRQVIVRCIAPYICWLLDLLVGKAHPTLLFYAIRHKSQPGAPTERVVLAINHGRNILQFDVRCKLTDEMQPLLCMVRFIAEVEMILLPSTTTLLYTYVYVVHSTSR
jgi:hypothetical protein